jgi:hypothetical protein
MQKIPKGRYCHRIGGVSRGRDRRDVTGNLTIRERAISSDFRRLAGRGVVSSQISFHQDHRRFFDEKGSLQARKGQITWVGIAV